VLEQAAEQIRGIKSKSCISGICYGAVEENDGAKRWIKEQSSTCSVRSRLLLVIGAWLFWSFSPLID
jgi:hypothetical protein